MVGVSGGNEHGLLTLTITRLFHILFSGWRLRIKVLYIGMLKCKSVVFDILLYGLLALFSAHVDTSPSTEQLLNLG